MNFKDYIHQETQIDNETLTLLDNLFKPKEYKKYSFLLKKDVILSKFFILKKVLLERFIIKAIKTLPTDFMLKVCFICLLKIFILRDLFISVLKP